MYPYKKTVAPPELFLMRLKTAPRDEGPMDGVDKIHFRWIICVCAGARGAALLGSKGDSRRRPVIVVDNPYPVQELDEMTEHRFIVGQQYIPGPSKGANFVPAPAAAVPDPYTYPKADHYECNETIDKRWTRSLCYTTLFTPSEKGLLRDRLLKTKTPPLLPCVVEGKIVVDPITGMIQMPGSIPFVQHKKDDPDEAVTLADGKDGEAPMIPIYAIPGLNRNARSVDLKKLPPGSFDGSYNLASTRGEGQGAGVTMPAVHASTPEATEHRTLVLRLLHAIQRLILPRSISKFEYDVTEAHSKLNNIVSFGGLDPNGTSCQMNVGSAGSLVAPEAGTEPEYPPIAVLGEIDVEQPVARQSSRAPAAARMEESIITPFQPPVARGEPAGSSIPAARQSSRAAALKEPILDLEAEEWNRAGAFGGMDGVPKATLGKI
ncbi:hypothetical protein B0H14DRAFT_3554677 [Mycena olivaceomarginata]|nr:hypothetical protein B0H14DRAFT_3554677 [Mycena olivaceomarginata]